MSELNTTCPNCGTPGMHPFYEIAATPVHSVLLMHTQEQAVSYPKGRITLASCDECGFVSNIAFDASLHEYDGEYEATQAYSPTFNKFHTNLAQRLIDKYELHDKDIIEIGCGMGEFLIMLCEMGPNRGVGFDPAYVEGRLESEARDRMTFIKDYYSEKYTSYDGDFVVCKMTLEHISDTAEFIATVRRSVGERYNATIFFQIPNAEYVMRDVAYWDVYYEHCSYFNLGSLAYLFESNGFEVLDLASEYDNQYIMVEARPRPLPGNEISQNTRDLIEKHRGDAPYFAEQAGLRRADWRNRLDAFKADGKKVVIWGGGSKGVSFLSTLAITDEIAYAVDINPNKHGCFMPGTGHETVSPEFLQTYQPDVVIVMNPIYCAEIQADLERLGVSAEMLAVE